MISCNKCAYCPCMRNECDLQTGQCDFGKTLIQVYSEKEESERVKKYGEY